MTHSINKASSPIQASVTIPGSKSLTNRALLLAALARGVSDLSGLLFSDDTWAFIQALRALGVSVEVDTVTCTSRVIGCDGRFPATTATIDCDKAGTAARFLVAACAGMSGQYFFDGHPQLRQRPMASLVTSLVQQGARIDSPSLPLQVQASAGLLGGSISMMSLESSQFVSAFMMVAPFAKQAMTLHLPPNMRRTYSDMTAAVMRDFGVDVVSQAHAYEIRVPQYYHARSYVIEPDFSTASYFFAAAAVTAGRVTIPCLQRETRYQGDSQFLSVLEQMGCVVTSDHQGITVVGPDILRGVDVDMQSYSDVFMTLAAIAPFAQTPTTIRHIAHTRLQESDRIRAMRRGLEALHVQVEEGVDSLTIYPSTPQAGVVQSQDDHRIAMAFSLIGLRVAGIEIAGAACVTKTCPDFFERWARLV